MRYAIALAGGYLCFLVTPFASAQELSPGKYSGSATGALPGTQVSYTLDIKSVANGVVEGRGERQAIRQDGKRVEGGGGCIGGFPLAGTVKGDAIELRATEKFGASGDCSFRLIGTVTGNKIVGKIGGKLDIELTR